MTEPERLTADVEIRETGTGKPRLVATLIREGTASTGGRAEVFEPNSITWAEDGVDVLVAHYGQPEARAVPVREQGGAIRVDVPATDAVVRAVRGGKDKASVEFHPIRETRTAGGVRAIQRAFMTGFSLTDDPEYPGTRAEVRERRPVLWL